MDREYGEEVVYIWVSLVKRSIVVVVVVVVVVVGVMY